METSGKSRRLIRPGFAPVLASVLLFALTSSIATAQTIPKRPVSSVPSIRVEHGKSEIDGEHWTVLTVTTGASYQGWISTRRPELSVVCRQNGEKRKIFFILNSGPLESVREDGNPITRIRVDDAEPTEYIWGKRSDHQSYQSMNPNDWTSAQDMGTLDSFLHAKTVLIEIHPFMTSKLVVVRFDVRGLLAAFEKSAECRTADQAPPPQAPLTPPGNPANGKALFDEHCVRCHNADTSDPKYFPTANKRVGIGPGLKGLSHQTTFTMHRLEVAGPRDRGPGVAFSETDKNDLLAYLATL